MTKIYIRSVLGILAACCCMCAGCTAVGGTKTASDELNLVLAGMKGNDGVSFEGAAGVLLDGKLLPDSALHYGGKVEEHKKVSLYSVLPDKGQTAVLQDGEEEYRTAGTFSASLVKEGGEWKSQAEEISGSGNPLPALNPLLQLEELQALNKAKVTKEGGNMSGTAMLRAELTPEAAREQLTSALEQEMQAIRSGISGSTGAKQTSEVAEALTSLWAQKDKELRKKLESAEVKSVYSLQVDTKRKRPKKLIWTRTLHYPGTAGTDTDEKFVSEVEFYGYR